jgi:SAM-dependent methyltransferase
MSVVDVGCGVGTWLRAVTEKGIGDIMGIDGSYVDRAQLQIPADRFRVQDLTEPFRIERRFDLAISLEVAEHVPPAAAKGFVASLVSLSPVILFSAAIPFQCGTHHVNEQWPSYWASLFREHDYYFWDCLRSSFWNEDDIPCCYRQNAFLVATSIFFDRRGMPTPKENPMALIHPNLWNERNDSEIRLRTIRGMLSELVRIVGRPIKRKLIGPKN